MPDVSTMIDLAAPRTIVFPDRGNLYTYTLAPITGAQWKRYFDGIVSTVETIDKQPVQDYDNATASADLVRSAVANVNGYHTPNGEEIASLQNWQAMLPLAHLLTVAGVLRAVERADSEERITLGNETVTLAAVWGVSTDGKAMRRIARLVHRFTPPTIEHQRRYDRAFNRSVVIGGSRSGKTRWLGAQNTLIDIYDELIVSVDGYHLAYEPMDLDAIRLRMDAYHKVAAAQALFATATIDEQEVTANG